MKNYQPVSLLPICRKILEILMFNEMFRYFIEKTPWHICWFSINFCGTFEINNYQGKWNYGTVVDIAKDLPRPVLVTRRSSCETTSRLWYHNLWYSLQKVFHQKLESIQYNVCLVLLGSVRIFKGKILPRLRLRIPPMLTFVLKLCLFY